MGLFHHLSITNMHPTNSVQCYLELLKLPGSQIVYKAATITPNASWRPATESVDCHFYLTEDRVGYGTYEIITPHNTPQ